MARARQQTQPWGSTVLTGRVDATGVNPVSSTLRIRVQHDFRAKDITFKDSSADQDQTLIKSIFFGDRSLWTVPDGAPIDMFKPTGFFRDLLLGEEMKGGLDIIITADVYTTGSPTATGRLTAVISGTKPKL